MSAENIAAVKKLYEGWCRGDFRVALDLYHPDVEMIVDTSVLGGIIAYGFDAMAYEWGRTMETWEGFHAGEPEEIHDLGDRVLVINRLYGRGKHSGLEMDALRGAVFTFREGKLVRMFLADVDAARREAGLDR